MHSQYSEAGLRAYAWATYRLGIWDYGTPTHSTTNSKYGVSKAHTPVDRLRNSCSISHIRSLRGAFPRAREEI